MHSNGAQQIEKLENNQTNQTLSENKWKRKEKKLKQNVDSTPYNAHITRDTRRSFYRVHVAQDKRG